MACPSALRFERNLARGTGYRRGARRGADRPRAAAGRRAIAGGAAGREHFRVSST